MRNKPHKIPKVKAIKAVGIELEGAWTRYYKDGIPLHNYIPHATTVRNRAPRGLKYDGSVRINVRDSGCHFYGEIASKPMKPRAITSWVRRNQPDGFNNSCGAHMHISTVGMNDYMSLTHIDFWHYFRKNLAKWGKKKEFPKTHQFWTRYKGNNTYCKPLFIPEKQIHEGSDRYTQVNFCWSKHQTIEFRVLPIFETADLQIESFLQLIEITENYLNLNPSHHSRKWAVKEQITDYQRDLKTIYEETIDPKKQYKSQKIVQRPHGDSSANFFEEWNQNEHISLSKPTSDQAKKTYYVVTSSNAHLAPETMEHITQNRANMNQDIFEEEDDIPIESTGETQNRELTANALITF